MRSYEQLGMTQLAADTRRVLEKTYPQSEYVSRGFKSSNQPWWKFW
jgi:outer membrane protein assembly factor BamD